MVASWPLATGLTPWVATPLLGLVGCYGLLVITGTPVRHVPDRLAGLAELFGYQRPFDEDYDEDDDYDEDEDERAGGRAAPPRHRPRPDQAEGGDRGRGPPQAVRHPRRRPRPAARRRGWRGRPGRRGRRAAGGQDRHGPALGTRVRRRSGRGGRGTRSRWGPRGRGGRRRAGRTARRRDPAGLVRPGPGGRAAEADRAGAGQLRAAADGAAASRHPAQGADQGQRHRDRGPAGRVRAVQGRRAGGRVQPRPDRDQVRDRARARR